VIDLDNGVATIDVTETVQSGFDLFAASCTGATGNGAFVDGSDGVEGLQVAQGDAVSCIFYNTPQCTSNAQCDDGEPCTIDVCDPSDPGAGAGCQNDMLGVDRRDRFSTFGDFKLARSGQFAMTIDYRDFVFLQQMLHTA